ncbi:AraC family transcriptional regulator [Lederbergia sp. NSJ-179]|uniref:AraC family transcriptional regulator n=1 Tax=Lederbergia sp. NSJ-179 TaxID=2931402 RepID=UPI001FD2C45A|nr:AraC family transcriptional regulator [Lederbergia sp. NSJ-179]MCJ7842989.1 AraC family transcriptional regulator [Lederbergia sp. NSJ-179]
MSATRYRSQEYMKNDEFPFWIRQYRHDSVNVPPAHSHEFIELVYVVKGEAKHVFNGQTYRIQTNDIFIINPGEVHTFQVEPGKKIDIINCLFLPNLIQDSWLKELGVSQSMDYFYIHPFLDNRERFHHLLNLKGTYSERVYSLLEGMMYEYAREGSCYPTLIRLQLVELLILLSRIYNEQQSNQQDPATIESSNLLVRRVCGYLARNYDQKISIPSLCKLFMISSRHLNRLFKQETNQTVVEMLQVIRIEKAKYFLTETNDKIIDIAIKVGYDDPAFFSRLFRRVVNCSPGKYREQHQKVTLNES